MQAQGFEVVIAAAGGPDLEALCRSEGVRGWNVPVIRPLRPWHDLKTLRALRRVIDEERPDIVHGHTPKGVLLGLLAASSRACRGASAICARCRSRPGAGPGAGCCTAASAGRRDQHRHLRDQPLARRGLPAPAGPPPGAGHGDRGRQRQRRRRPRALRSAAHRAGRPRGVSGTARAARGRPRAVLRRPFGAREGHGELAAAWAVLRERDPDLRLLLAGRLDEREPVAAEVLAMLAADPRVCLPGYVYERELAFALATVHVLPTWREGFGTVLLEAAAMAVPAVASRVTGCIDAVVDGVTGTLVAPRSAPALVEALGRYLDDPDLRAAHGRAARRRALAEFAPERVWQELARRYRGPAAKADPQAALSNARVSDQPARQR